MCGCIWASALLEVGIDSLGPVYRTKHLKTLKRESEYWQCRLEFLIFPFQLLRGSVENNDVFALTNLSWQKFATPSRDRTIHVGFTDFSCVSKNPKASYLRDAMARLLRCMVSSYISLLFPIFLFHVVNKSTLKVERTVFLQLVRKCLATCNLKADSQGTHDFVWDKYFNTVDWVVIKAVPFPSGLFSTELSSQYYRALIVSVLTIFSVWNVCFHWYLNNCLVSWIIYSLIYSLTHSFINRFILVFNGWSNE